MSGRRIRSLDGIRGFFSLVIIAIHVEGWIEKSSAFRNTLEGFAVLAVSFFFVISGFLVHRSHFEKAPLETKPVLNFYCRRFFRIIPLWWSLLFVLFIVFPYINIQFSFNSLFMNMFFLFGFFSYDRLYLPIIFPAWTLFVEESFYLLFPLIFTSLTPRKTIYWLIFSYVVAALWLYYAPRYGVPTDLSFVERFPLANFKYFFLGIALSVLYGHKLKWKAVSERLRPFMDFLVLGCVAGLFFKFKIREEVLFLSVFLASLIPGTQTGKMMEWRWLNWLGVRCYGLYLIHSRLIGPVYLYIFNKWPSLMELPEAVRFFILFTVVASFTILIAAFTYKYIERPSILLGEKIISSFEKKRKAEAGIVLPLQADADASYDKRKII